MQFLFVVLPVMMLGAMYFQLMGRPRRSFWFSLCASVGWLVVFIVIGDGEVFYHIHDKVFISVPLVWCVVLGVFAFVAWAQSVAARRQLTK